MEISKLASLSASRPSSEPGSLRPAQSKYDRDEFVACGEQDQIHTQRNQQIDLLRRAALRGAW